MYKDRYKFDYVALGNKIKSARKEKCFTQEKLSEAVGMSAKYISDVERGKKHISFPALIDIANCLEMSAIDLTSPWLSKNPTIFNESIEKQDGRLTLEQRILVNVIVKNLTDYFKIENSAFNSRK